MDHEYDVMDGYLPSFVQHLKDTRARLGLRDEKTGTEDAVEESDGGHWTTAEQDAFFRAVSVYSRWRPDLIAACVPTKAEWVVWMYLEALEEGVAALAPRCVDEDSEMDMDMEDGCRDERPGVSVQPDSVGSSRSGSRSGSDADEDWDEDGEDVVDERLCEPALEVSQAWIDAEERMASWIVCKEHLATVGGGDAPDVEDGEEPPKRKRGRPPKRARVQSRARSASNQDRPSPSPARRSPPDGSRSTSACEREALMSCLGVSHLLVLDSILREGEEAMHGKGKSREGSVTVAEHGDEEVPVRDTVPSSSHGAAAAQGTSSTVVSNAVIDPALLALSGGATSQGTLTAPPPDRPPLGDTFTFALDSAPLAQPGPSVHAESDLSLFSPRSRRRIQKRLYMRRKRALLGDAGSERAVHTGVEKLKPGKKAKPQRREATSVPCSETPSDVEMKSEDAPKKSTSGLTLPYKLKAQFMKLGVDAGYLRDQGMDLLNLGVLGRLMGSLEQGEQGADGSALAESVDAELIRHLQAALVSFVTDIVHRTIVWREREIRLKQRSRAWRHGDQITLGAVEHAVKAVGARCHGHCPDARVGEAGPARDVYAPAFYPPSGWGMGPLATLAQTYEREAARTRRGTGGDGGPEALLSDGTDEGALAGELRAEAAVDGRDTAAGAREERALWEGILN